MVPVDSAHLPVLIQRTLNYVDPRLVDHGRRVAFLVGGMLSLRPHMAPELVRDLCYLALLHDVGAYKTEEIDKLVAFETENVWDHAIYGYLFLRALSPLGKLAPVVLFHHASAFQLDRAGLSPELREFSQLFHVADRADILWQSGRRSEQQVAAALTAVPGRFDDSAIALFLAAQRKYRLLERLETVPDLHEFAQFPAFSPRQREEFLKMLVFAIDFRSPHTVTHTLTTTGVSRELASLLFLTEEARARVGLGALLHDLGKIAIPVEILEYPGKLSPQAMAVMRTHVEITERILTGCVPREILQVAVRHHEKLDGSGYSKGLRGEDLNMEQRIVAVADIVSALCGERSYKRAFPKEKTLSILKNMRDAGQLDRQVVDTVEEHFDHIMARVQEEAGPVVESYLEIHREYKAAQPPGAAV